MNEFVLTPSTNGDHVLVFKGDGTFLGRCDCKTGVFHSVLTEDQTNYMINAALKKKPE